jgi:signal transduction histidine kinase
MGEQTMDGWPVESGEANGKPLVKLAAWPRASTWLVHDRGRAGETRPWTRFDYLTAAAAAIAAGLLCVVDMTGASAGADLTAGPTLAVPVLYALVLAAGLRLPDARLILAAAAVVSVLTVAAGALAAEPDYGNRLIALTVIWGAALLLQRHHRQTEELAVAQVERERVQRSKARFLSSAGHDLRHPIQAGFLFHDLLQRRLRNTPHLELVEQVGQSFTAMQKMLDGLLELARLDFGEIEARPGQVAVSSLFQRLSHHCAPMASGRLTVVDSGAMVLSDSEMLLRIVTNLVENALKHSKSSRVLVGCRRTGRSLRLQVWDSGPGIAEERLRDLLHEFKQIRAGTRETMGGLGLGLAVVERLARRLGHSVAVRSAVGRGSMFEVVVPLAGPSLI